MIKYPRKKVDFIDIDFVKTKNGRGVIANKSFDNIREFMDTSDAMADAIIKGCDYWSPPYEDDTWVYGGHGTKKSKEMLYNGTSTDELLEYVDMYRRELELQGLYDLQSNFKSTRRRRRFSDDGDNLNIDRYLSGDLDVWEKTKRDGRKQYIKLAINFGQNAGSGEKEFSKNTALAYCVSEILENLGYGVEIIGTACSKKCIDIQYFENAYGIEVLSQMSSYGSVSFTLKKSTEYADLSSLASTSLTSLFRHWAFASRKYLYGIEAGASVHPPQEFCDMLGINIFIGNMKDKYKDENDVQKVSKIIREIVGE